jgi:hypothetical protein
VCLLRALKPKILTTEGTGFHRVTSSQRRSGFALATRWLLGRVLDAEQLHVEDQR